MVGRPQDEGHYSKEKGGGLRLLPHSKLGVSLD